MQPHYSQSSRENATPSSGTSPLAYYKEVHPPGRKGLLASGVSCLVRMLSAYTALIMSSEDHYYAV